MTHVCTIVTSNVFSLDYFDKGSLVERIHRLPFEIAVVLDGWYELLFNVPAEQRQCPRFSSICLVMALEPVTVVSPHAFVRVTGQFVSIRVHSNLHLLADFHAHFFCAILELKYLLQFVPVCDDFETVVHFAAMSPPVTPSENLWILCVIGIETHCF